MNWIGKLLGRHGREYRGPDFSVRMETIFREVVAVIYTRNGSSLKLSGERFGRKWETISVSIPEGVEAGQLPSIVNDLKIAFEALRYDYLITRKTGIETVPEPERQAALAELHEMGYDIVILPDRKIRQEWRADVPRPDLETIRRTTPRMMKLMQSVHGTRQISEVLAESKDSSDR
jgi:hypothetical protein